MDAVTADLDAVARQGMAVKVKVIEVDPYEKGVRQALNLGHTVGHGVELASAFRLSHGEAVAIGTVVEAKIARRLGLAEDGLAQTISGVLESLGLPVKVPPELDPARIIAAMQMDKKRAAGKVTFALPERIGAVRVGVEVPGWQEIIFEK
jgi:3-dehydroquinate synthetase